LRIVDGKDDQFSLDTFFLLFEKRTFTDKIIFVKVDDQIGTL